MNAPYLVDANVFLEVQLSQKNAGECEVLLGKFRDGELSGVVTDFSVDSILIIMENHAKKPVDLRVFLSSMMVYEGLELYALSLVDRILATKIMEKYGLDFDDSITYQAMRTLNIRKVVSYDDDFDVLTDVERVTPADLI